MSNEPTQLRRGKAFHKLIQEEWAKEAEGEITSEYHILKPNGRRGRIDIFVNDSCPNSPVAIVEIKATDWDKIDRKNLRRNIKRQIRQIWNYIESQIAGGHYTERDEGKDVCPGVIFPKRPEESNLIELVEELFFEDGIQVVWYDETIAHCKDRNKMQSI